MLNEFISIEYLSTFAGMVIILGLIVQFTKGIIKVNFSDQAVRAYTFAWALVLVLLSYLSQGLFEAAGREIAMTLFLALINAIIVTLAAMGGYEVFADPKAEKTKTGV
jgi:hypothetical protein